MTTEKVKEGPIPLPVGWFDHEWNLVDAEDQPLALVAQCLNDKDNSTRVAVAKQIRLALNSQPALLAACEAALMRMDEDDLRTEDHGIVAAAAQLRAAIKLAKGKEI